MANLRDRMNDVMKKTTNMMNTFMKSEDMVSSMAYMDDDSVLVLRDCMTILDQCSELYVDIAAELDRLKVIESKLDLLIAKGDKA